MIDSHKISGSSALKTLYCNSEIHLIIFESGFVFLSWTQSSQTLIIWMKLQVRLSEKPPTPNKLNHNTCRKKKPMFDLLLSLKAGITRCIVDFPRFSKPDINTYMKHFTSVCLIFSFPFKGDIGNIQVCMRCGWDVTQIHKSRCRPSGKPVQL